MNPHHATGVIWLTECLLERLPDTLWFNTSAMRLSGNRST
jgi:hypothetical protein